MTQKERDSLKNIKENLNQMDQAQRETVLAFMQGMVTQKALQAQASA